MRHLLYLVVCVLLLISCSSSRNTMPEGKGITGTGTVIIPRVVAKSFQKELAGNWIIISMRRQQKAELEQLIGVTLKFSETDVKFTGKAPCNTIFGTIQLKGYSIRFIGIGSTEMACDRLEQETEYINLLQNRISAFTIDGDKLYLRDGISNIVFEGERIQ